MPRETLIEIEDTDDNIKKYQSLILRFKNINSTIKFYNEFINNNKKTSDPENKNQVVLYLNKLDALYQEMPSFDSKTAQKGKQNGTWKLLVPIISLLGIAAGISIRVAQRNFSVQVVSDPNLYNQTITEQTGELLEGMVQALKIPENFVLGTTDVIFSFAASLVPFGLTNIINLFSKEKISETNLDHFNPTDIIIQVLENTLQNNNFQELELYYEKLDSLCCELEKIIKSNNLEDSDLNQMDPNENDIEESINKLNKTREKDSKKTDYSSKKLIKNSIENARNWIVIAGVSHCVITLSSAYSAQTFSWENYEENLITFRNILSTFVRVSAMKYVNDLLIKKPLQNIINILGSLVRKNNDENKKFSLEQVKKDFSESIKKYNKPTQAVIIFAGFITITFISNFIKTLAADVVQNKGNIDEAWKQLNETFFTPEMVGIASLVTGSDMLALQLKMKESLSMLSETKKEREIIDRLFSSISYSPTANSNFPPSAPSIDSGETNNISSSVDIPEVPQPDLSKFALPQATKRNRTSSSALNYPRSSEQVDLPQSNSLPNIPQLNITVNVHQQMSKETSEESSLIHYDSINRAPDENNDQTLPVQNNLESKDQTMAFN